MIIGIIGAMDVEIESLVKDLYLFDVYEYAGMNFRKGELCGKEVVITQSGVGKVNAAACAQILVSRFGVTHIINTGCAGAIHGGLQIGDVVIASDVIYHDVDCTLFGYENYQLPKTSVVFTSDSELIDVAKRAAIGEMVFVRRIASGDRFIHDSITKESIRNGTNAVCCDMEAAAIGHVASINKIPFVVIRTISDLADETVEVVYDEQKAAETSAEIVKGIIRRI